MLVLSIWITNMVLEARAVSRVTPIVTSRGAPYRFVAHHKACRDPLPHTFDIGVGKTIKKNSTAIKYIHN